MHELLAPAGFADEVAALRRLEGMAGGSRLLPALAPGLFELLLALANCANPDRALLNVERLVHSHPDPLASFRALTGDPRRLEAAITLFAGSQFLSEILLRNPGYLARLQERKQLAQIKTLAQFRVEAERAAAANGAGGYNMADGDVSCIHDISERHGQPLDALRRWQRWELLRIGACDLLGLLDLATVTGQLSRLAESLVRTCLAAASEAAGIPADGLAVIALGKLGGGELNYSSDIDLVFVAGSPEPGYTRLGQGLIDALTQMTGEGFLYRVDMQLRPWGRSGPLVSSLDAYSAYLERHARLWEKQALLKARPVAGDEAVGREFLRRTEPLLLGVGGETVRSDVHEMKQRIEAELARRGREWGEVKLGRGSIRDVEFVTQYLQLVHGSRHPQVRGGNTLRALEQLAVAGLLPAEEQRALIDGYTFLRPLEHYLQMMQFRQTHSLPEDAREIAYLARRLGFQGAGAGSLLLARYQQHSAAIRAVYQKHLEGKEMGSNGNPQPRPPNPAVARHLARMVPSYAATFGSEEIAQHARLAERLGEGNLVEVDAVPLAVGQWRVTIVAYDYPGELSLICGLLFVYGFSIRDGDVFTYEPLLNNSAALAAGAALDGGAPGDQRRKIVDVFNVQPVLAEVTADTWTLYARDLAALLGRLQAREQREAQGELAKRAAVTIGQAAGPTPTLHPIEIEIDNESSERYTVLRIDAPDTIGFLYEFTNALALSGIYIAQVSIDSAGNRAHDTLYLSDAAGRKIASARQQRELRAATVLVKHFTHLLLHSPNPEAALLHFHEFLGQLFGRADWPGELASLERPEVLSALARLLGVSDFLWDDFLRMQHANLFPVLRDVDALAAGKTRGQLQAELAAALAAAADAAGRRAALNAYKDREMFRIDMRHIQGRIGQLGQFSGELTDLAEAVVEAAYRLCDGELRGQYGEPRLEDGRPCPLCICALGKCAGRELGYASDIELMFVYGGSGSTGGPQVIASGEYYEKLVLELTQAIRARREGIFQIDLQLRPHGKAGSLAVSLESFRRYFAPGGAAWDYERQALLKLRPIAGERELAEQLLALRDEYVYGGELFDVAAMRAMRERQIRHLVRGGTFNAKYSPGGLVDVEYLVQGLQIVHGRHNPALRIANTREAISALAAAGVLSREDYARLREAHIFLRHLIDALRMVRGNAKDLAVPPTESEDFIFLARRLGYGGETGVLKGDLERYTGAVLELSRRRLGWGDGDGQGGQV